MLRAYLQDPSLPPPGRSPPGELEIRDDKSLSACCVIRHLPEMEREDWRIRIIIRTELRGDRGDFHLTSELIAVVTGSDRATRRWTDIIARDLI